MRNPVLQCLKFLRDDSGAYGVMAFKDSKLLLDLPMPDEAETRILFYQVSEQLRKAGLIEGTQRQMVPSQLFGKASHIPLGENAALRKMRGSDEVHLDVDFSGKDADEIRRGFARAAHYAEHPNPEYECTAHNLSAIFKATGLPNVSIKTQGDFYAITLPHVDNVQHLLEGNRILAQEGILPRDDARYMLLGTPRGEKYYEMLLRIPEELTPQEIQQRCFFAECQMRSKDPLNSTLWTERVCAPNQLAAGKPVGGKH